MIVAPPLANRILRVLGIDPGLADVGYGVIDHNLRTGKSQVVEFGVLQTPAGVALAERLGMIYRQVGLIVTRFAPSVVSVEQLFFAKNTKTAMVVAHGRAACILAAGEGRVVVEYTAQIKKALTGHGNAGKMQVQQMVRAVLGLNEVPRPDHAADALGAALCHVHSLGMKGKISAAVGKSEIVTIDLKQPSGKNAMKALLEQARVTRRKRR